MRYLVFDSEAEARATERVIFRRGAILAQSVGYHLDEAGAIVGERDGEPDPLGLTTVWDDPRLRADGKWVILHPEHHSAAENSDWLAFVMRGIDAVVDEGGAP